MDPKERREKVKILKKAASLEGSEVGETWHLLVDIFNRLQIDYVSEEFAEAFLKEIDQQIESFEAEFEFIDEEREVTKTERVVDLIWKG